MGQQRQQFSVELFRQLSKQQALNLLHFLRDLDSANVIWLEHLVRKIQLDLFHFDTTEGEKVAAQNRDSNPQPRYPESNALITRPLGQNATELRDQAGETAKRQRKKRVFSQKVIRLFLQPHDCM